jgi:general stress protein YciG
MAEEQLTPDQRRARTRMEKDPDFYKKIGSKGGKNNKTKFNSESAKAAVEARWAKKRAEQSQKGKNDEHGTEAT